MDRILRRMGALPLGGMAITLIVALTLWRPNMNRLGYEHALPTIAIVVVTAGLVTLALRYLLGSWSRAGIASALLVAFIVYSVPIANAVAGATYAPLLVGLFLVLTLLAARKVPSDDSARDANGKLNLLLIGVAVFMAVGIAVQQVRLESVRPPASAQFEPFDGRVSESAPDVWHILFDRYASNDTLARRYGFDNASLMAELKKRGFAVEEGSFSNYQRTAHSVASTLNGASLDRLSASVAGPKNDWLPIYRAISHNQATSFFERNGYRTIFAGTWWSPTRKLNTSELISYRALPELGRLMLDQSVIGAALRWTGLPYGDGRAEQCEREKDKFARLEALAKEPGRKFVFAHFLIPHPPFVLAADGSCKSLEQAQRTSRRDNYVDQVRYSNAGTLRLVDAILAGPRPAVIVVHSDEGPWPEPFVGNEHALGRDPVSVDWRHVDAGRLQEKMGILMAVRSPSGLPATMPTSPVQIYPSILRDNFAGRASIPANTYQVFESDAELYRFHDVAPKLRGS